MNRTVELLAQELLTGLPAELMGAALVAAAAAAWRAWRRRRGVRKLQQGHTDNQ